ncbi:hypothetical protein [Aquabacterium sp. CECT 9606]|uniref:hypothetical protein n=1 Tax=Aquabacterium sp. CECT 9606 TaxID=2845822 RepID=UPI001E2F5516|nr:hypothetical protein [Aquabacterium sp. CECT 9606]CAH0351951.1 hypothetical protein AQB9606_02528 [Aquabacterium sp. CECT 9606]
MTHTIPATVQLRANEAVDRLAQAAHHAVDRAAAKAEALGETQDAWLASARLHVQQRPLRSVLIALAAGLVIDRLLR